MSETSRTPIFSMRGGAKSFGALTVIQGLDIDVFENEIVGIAGENGAGKSTTLKMFAGIHKPTLGSMTLFGKPYDPHRYTDAVRAGVSMVFQEQALVPNLRVYENMFLSHENRFSRYGVVETERMIDLAARKLKELGLAHIDPRRTTRSYEFHDRQMIEIAKAFVLADFFEVAHPLVLLDEPTAAIGEKEVEILFESVRRFRDHASFVLITHRLAEYVALCDRLYVMKDGRLVSEMGKASFADTSRIHEAMVGRARDEEYYKESEQLRLTEATPIVLSVDGVSGAGAKDVSFSLRKGEILGIGGLVGCGKEEVSRAIVGYEPFPMSGTITINGKAMPAKGRGAASIGAGVGFVPKERKTEGIIPYMSVAANTSLASLPQVTRVPGFISASKETQLAREYITQFRTRTTGPAQLCQYLSGGNQQKVAIAKWLARGVEILVLDNPTRGVDVGAKEEIYALMRDLTAKGVAILLITDDLLELIGLSNRILIMRDGAIVNECPAPPEAKPTEQELVGYMV